MSTDTPSLEPNSFEEISNARTEQWTKLQPQLLQLSRTKACLDLFGSASHQGNIYRWGVAASTGTTCAPLIHGLSRLACFDGKPKFKNIDLDLAAAEVIDLVDRITNFSPLDAATVNLWAASMPALADRIEPHRWWRLLASLQHLQESILQRGTAYSRSHLMLGGELGLTLAWRLPNIASCKLLSSRSATAVKQWAECEQESITAALATPQDIRLILASLLRCRPLIEKVSKQKFSKTQKSMTKQLATWAAAMTHPKGTAFSSAKHSDLFDDHTKSGLIEHAIGVDRDTLGPAFSAAKGEPHAEGRLAWEVGLPKTIHHDTQSRVVVAFPDWDVRRGRYHFDYSGDEAHLELFAGRRQVLNGRTQLSIKLDHVEQQPAGVWDVVCEYSDDDVHYLEIEQPWTGKIHVQRQIFLIRDDRCLMIADAVLPQDTSSVTDLHIDYRCNFPLANGIAVALEPETREVFLADEKKRGMVFPLSASEWSVGPTDAQLTETSDQHLQLSATGTDALFAPLWFDFQKRRFNRNRTWRQLTVGEQLRLVPRNEAAGYRIQVGSEQWMAYRSLRERSCRTVLGKHLIANFFCSRFDPSDGSHDELLTVDDTDDPND